MHRTPGGLIRANCPRWARVTGATSVHGSPKTRGRDVEKRDSQEPNAKVNQTSAPLAFAVGPTETSEVLQCRACSGTEANIHAHGRRHSFRRSAPAKGSGPRRKDAVASAGCWMLERLVDRGRSVAFATVSRLVAKWCPLSVCG